MPTSIRRNIIYSIYLVVVVFLLLELVLRIYNPFQFRIRGNQILLPIKLEQTIRNDINPKLDSLITNTRNSIGFRGSEPPADWQNQLTLVIVGGSTTECHFLSDQHTWPYLLEKQLNGSFNKLWINNAGLDGHSTFGHQVMLNDYLVTLKPKVIVFLTGINDMENGQPTFHDELNRKGGYSDFKHFIFYNSEVLSTALNLVRGWRARKLNNVSSRALELEKGSHREISDAQIDKRISQQAPFLLGYQKRLEQLIDTCRRYQITPVFLTQPTQFGQGIDPVTGVDLETFDTGQDMNGKCLAAVLEVYNNSLKNICRQRNVPVIDLEQQMPRNSLYYYDGFHFTNAGAEKVAEIVATGLQPILADKFISFMHE